LPIGGDSHPQGGTQKKKKGENEFAGGMIVSIR